MCCVVYLLAIAAISPRIFVATSSSSPQLAAGLAEELGKNALVERAEDADLTVALVDARGSHELELVVRLASGAAVVKRSISLEDGPTPALRVAVLLVRAAVEEYATRQRERPAKQTPDDALAEPGQPKTSTTPPSRPAVETNVETNKVEPALERARDDEPLSLRVSPLFAVSAWSRPFLPPQIGLGVSAAVTWRRFAFGGTLLASGHLCCERTSDEITASAHEVLIAADAGFAAIDAGTLTIGVHVAPGFNMISGDAAVREPKFAGPGTPEHYSAVQAIALGDVSASIALSDRFALVVRVGVKATLSGRRPLAVPEPLAMGAKPLDSGVITPFLLSGVSIKVF